MAALESDRLFPTQASLPPLPLPTLQQTCERYLNTARPLLTPQEMEHTEAVVADFCREGGEGEALQALLQEKADTERNWIEEWWEQAAYLRTRTTMAIHVNWFGVLPEWGFEITNVQAAAAVLYGVMYTRTMLMDGTLPLEKLRGNPLDMHQFTRLFGMTRVPGVGVDTLEQSSNSSHVVLMRRGALFQVELYAPDGTPYELRTLQSLVLAVLEEADDNLFERVDEPPISVFTSMDRDSWAEERIKLLGDPTNAASLKAVESALFCLTLDPARPADKQRTAELSLCGDGRNKWYDKSFTVVVFENGRVGLNAEHSPIDAMTVVSLFTQALKGIGEQVKHAKSLLLASPAPLSSGVWRPRKLEWNLDSAQLRTLEVASVKIAQLASRIHLVVLHFHHFGKGMIKHAKVHPDFFMQMALQLAYFRLHRRFVATYETGTARAFYHGRTDTVRTLSEASVAFVSKMQDEDAAPEEKLAALRAACDAHGEQLQQVLSGQGIDRHLLGLYIAAMLRGEKPAIFTDKAYALTGGGGNYKLSTSNVGYTAMFGGFSPMTPDGYGVCYAMLEGRMNISISTWRTHPETDADAMATSIINALCDMQALCAATTMARASKL